MLVVSDTSPIRALAQLGHLPVLGSLYGDVLVPPAVARELATGGRRGPVVQVADWSFIRVQSPADAQRVQTLLATLDPGESEALALALEVHPAAVLMDEKRGRMVAERMGIRTVGVLAVLVNAKDRKLLPLVRPLIDRLEAELELFTTPALRDAILRSAGEA